MESKTKDYINCEWCDNHTADRTVMVKTSKSTTFYFVCGFLCTQEIIQFARNAGHTNIKVETHELNYTEMWTWR